MHKRGICDHLVQNKCSGEQDPGSSLWSRGGGEKACLRAGLGKIKLPWPLSLGSRLCAWGKAAARSTGGSLRRGCCSSMAGALCRAGEGLACTSRGAEQPCLAHHCVSQFSAAARSLRCKLCASTATRPRVGIKSERTGASCKVLCHLRE